MAQLAFQEQYGPYGSQCPENYSFKLQDGETIKEVIVRHGFIVDAIGFVIAKPCGITYTKMFGGNDPRAKEAKIALKCGEQITQLSGTYGNYKYKDNICLIATIKIHTNLCPTGYGPFGQGEGVDCPSKFSSPLPIDGPINGFLEGTTTISSLLESLSKGWTHAIKPSTFSYDRYAIHLR